MCIKLQRPAQERDLQGQEETDLNTAQGQEWKGVG